MTGLELLAGAAVGYLVRKARRMGGRADVEVDRALDAGIDALHELVTTKLGGDTALQRLQEQAKTDTQTERRTERRVADAIADAAEDDAAFAEQLTQVVELLKNQEATRSKAAGANENMISGGTQHGPVFQGRDFSGPMTFGLRSSWPEDPPKDKGDNEVPPAR